MWSSNFSELFLQMLKSNIENNKNSNIYTSFNCTTAVYILLVKKNCNFVSDILATSFQQYTVKTALAATSSSI